MDFTLRVWRQPGPDAAGKFETYKATGISEDMSFLEVLDVVNEDLIEAGIEPIAFDHDCREGICGSCGVMINGQAHGPGTRTATCQLHMRTFKDGDTIAVLGFSPWSVAAVTDLDAVRRHVTRASRRYGRVVVTMHIGAEGVLARHTSDRLERFAGENRGNSVAFARAAVESGASLVVGHGPHVLRAMEWNGRALVAYSLGNLVTYGPFNHSGYNDHGAVLCATIAGDGAVRDASLRATRQRMPGFVDPDPDHLGIADVAELSGEDFPLTGVRLSPSGDVLPPRP